MLILTHTADAAAKAVPPAEHITTSPALATPGRAKPGWAGLGLMSTYPISGPAVPIHFRTPPKDPWEAGERENQRGGGQMRPSLSRRPVR